MDAYIHGWNCSVRRGEIDTQSSRDRMKAVHLLARHGARWIPADKSEIESVRRSLLKMTPDYTVELVWIMHKYGSCSREAVEQLLRTPTIKSHTAAHRERLQELMAAWRESRTCQDGGT